MLNNDTYRILTEVIAGLEKKVGIIREELETPVLCGSPYVLALLAPGESIEHALTYGETYPDMNASAKYAFRFHRRFDTSGMMLFTPENADKHAGRAPIDGKRIVPIHFRDWYKAQLAGAETLLSDLRARLSNITVSDVAILTEQ